MVHLCKLNNYSVVLGYEQKKLSRVLLYAIGILNFDFNPWKAALGEIIMLTCGFHMKAKFF
jgi:hypothetical protein